MEVNGAHDVGVRFAKESAYMMANGTGAHRWLGGCVLDS